MTSQQLSRLMRLSWEIQKRKKRNRSKSLIAAWAIFQTEDITIFYLFDKHKHANNKNRMQPARLGLFPIQ